MSKVRRRAAIAILLAATILAGAGGEPPRDSLYRLRAALVDQAGKATTLDRHRGHPVVVSMFYASCPAVCPLLVRSIRRLEEELRPAERARLRVLLVSLDPERDDPAALAAVAKRDGVDASRWSLARAEPEDVRRIAAALAIRHRRLPDGEISHSTILTLLDAEGRILAQTSSVAAVDAEFLLRLRNAIEGSR